MATSDAPYIGLVRQRYNPFGGAERIIQRTILALHGIGHRVALYTREWAPAPDAPAVDKQEPTPDRIVLCQPRYLTKVGREKKFAEAVHAAVNRQPPALVQTHERIPGFDLYRAGDGVHATWLELCAEAAGKRRLWSQQLNPFHHYLVKTERALFTHPTLRAVICNSQLVQRDIQQRFGLPLAQLPLIRNGIDSNVFYPISPAQKAALRQQYLTALNIPPEAHVFLFVGSGYARKGVGRLMTVWPALPPHAHLIVIGQDRQFKQYQQRAREQAQIHLLGPQANVRAWYQLADCFVLPTLYDPFPNAALEAMACGLPVITTQTCGAAEVLTPDIGWIVPALDQAALTQALFLAASLSRDTLTNRGLRAAQLAQAYSLENMGQALGTLYQTILT
ncbi:glycosyltransferase family 4 protein [Parvibium lacunae]|uniref:glycosyltransferase family 4 protein n=1 Tax=Parvibium lacunae TaxID=1888893 RepID=UPI001314E8E6|nr:glycosyltransferase family 4 protein [Parvibium lacunae]